LGDVLYGMICAEMFWYAETTALQRR
jgi:hypothetical protein